MLATLKNALQNPKKIHLQSYKYIFIFYFFLNDKKYSILKIKNNRTWTTLCRWIGKYVYTNTHTYIL